MSGVCSKGAETIVRVEARRGPAAFRPSEKRCFIGKSEGSNGVNIGFSFNCRGDEFHDFDDAVALIRCDASGKTKVEGLNLNELIPLAKWIRAEHDDC